MYGRILIHVYTNTGHFHKAAEYGFQSMQRFYNNQNLAYCVDGQKPYRTWVE